MVLTTNLDQIKEIDSFEDVSYELAPIIVDEELRPHEGQSSQSQESSGPSSGELSNSMGSQKEFDTILNNAKSIRQHIDLVSEIGFESDKQTRLNMINDVLFSFEKVDLNNWRYIAKKISKNLKIEDRGYFRDKIRNGKKNIIKKNITKPGWFNNISNISKYIGKNLPDNNLDTTWIGDYLGPITNKISNYPVKFIMKNNILQKLYKGIGGKFTKLKNDDYNKIYTPIIKKIEETKNKGKYGIHGFKIDNQGGIYETLTNTVKDKIYKFTGNDNYPTAVKGLFNVGNKDFWNHGKEFNIITPTFLLENRIGELISRIKENPDNDEFKKDIKISIKNYWNNLVQLRNTLKNEQKDPDADKEFKKYENRILKIYRIL